MTSILKFHSHALIVNTEASLVYEDFSCNLHIPTMQKDLKNTFVSTLRSFTTVSGIKLWGLTMVLNLDANSM